MELPRRQVLCCWGALPSRQSQLLASDLLAFPEGMSVVPRWGKGAVCHRHPGKHEVLTHCWFNVGPASATLA